MNLIVAKSDTVVDPRAVVIHLQSARVTHRAVVRPVRFYAVAFLAVPDTQPCKLQPPLLPMDALSRLT